MAEVPQSQVEKQKRLKQDHEHVRAALGAISIDHMNDIIASFHGADSHYFGKPLGRPNKINSIISKTDEHGKKTNELLAQNDTVAEALYDTFMEMRKLETVKTKPLMRMELKKGVDVDFTTLEHYAPKVAPTTEAYPVPSHLKDLIEGNDLGRQTYDRTVEVEGWDKQVFGQVEQFAQSERGTRLIKDLKIQSLQTLTPEQAVKLTLSMVHDLSKYSFDKAGEADGEHADKQTTMDLLEEGFAHKGDPEWAGNGVCRNIASNVKAVFESIKMNQTNVSMLHNTYVGYTGSYEDFRINKRENRGDSVFLDKEPEPGHAWNTFATVDAKGDASVTIIDVTWALQKTPEEAIESMDYTLTRSATKAHELFEMSENKQNSFHDLNNYYKKFLSEGFRKHHQSAQFEDMIHFITKEYLSAANTVLRDADPEWIKTSLPTAPGYIQGAAYRLGNNLEKSELYTLFQLSEGYAISNFDGILDSYIKGGQNPVFSTPQWRGESLAFTQDDLARTILGKLDADKIAGYANASPEFRIMARKHTPESLPSFDPESRLIDKMELTELARRSRINVMLSDNVRSISTTVERGFLKAAGGDKSRVARATANRDLYAKVANYQQIVADLAQK